MKNELKWIGLGLYWLLILGLIAPWLISATSDMAVFIGFFLIGVSAYVTYRMFLKPLMVR